ncbi:MAG: hypothetical protein ACI9XJ_001857, partial [Marivirga sp.]
RHILNVKAKSTARNQTVNDLQLLGGSLENAASYQKLQRYKYNMNFDAPLEAFIVRFLSLRGLPSCASLIGKERARWFSL